MSEEAATACVEGMKTDEPLRALAPAVEDVDARMALVNAGGFAGTAEEMRTVSQELDDAALDAMAGGGDRDMHFYGGGGSVVSTC